MREVLDMTGAQRVDGRLFFIRPVVEEWAKAESALYWDSIPGARFKPGEVRVYGWTGEENGQDDGRPVLIVHGIETMRYVHREGLGGLFGEDMRTVDRNMAPDWVLLGHRERLPDWVLASVIGEYAIPDDFKRRAA